MRYDPSPVEIGGTNLISPSNDLFAAHAAPKASPIEQLQSFLQHFSVEVTPGQAAKIERIADHVAPGTRISVTALPGADLAETRATATRLRREGMVPVPHIAARSLVDTAQLRNHLAALRDDASVDEVLLIAGGLGKAAGVFKDSMQVLETGLLDQFGIRRIGVAGHPEGSPDIPDRTIAEALAWKNAFAQRSDADFHIVTQFCFDGDAVIAWDRAMRLAGNQLPIHIGIPGPATIKTLLSYAKACGIGPSMRVLTRQASNITRLLTVSAPDEIVSKLADYKANDPHCGIEIAHFYPLGGFKRTIEWVTAVEKGAVRFGKKNSFTVIES